MRRTIALVGHQFRYELLGFVRNRQGVFFTLALPVLFLVIFASVFANNVVRVAGVEVRQSVYYVPNIMALGIIAASFVNLVISVTAARETGIYKRRRATPVPAIVLIVGRALAAVAVSFVMAVLLLAIGWIAYGASVPVAAVPGLVMTIAIATLSFCALAYAVSTMIGDQDAAQPVTLAATLPLYFISGIFVPAPLIPTFLTHVADVFPVRHLAQALLMAYTPQVSGPPGIPWGDLAVIAGWGIAAAVFSVRRFKWEPSRR